MRKTGVDNKTLVKKSAAKLKPIIIKITANPEWKKQFKIMEDSAKKLSKIPAFIID
jgi:hypothetical protein